MLNVDLRPAFSNDYFMVLVTWSPLSPRKLDRWSKDATCLTSFTGALFCYCNVRDAASYSAIWHKVNIPLARAGEIIVISHIVSTPSFNPSDAPLYVVCVETMRHA